MAIINIQISTIDEALHLQNAATIKIGKYQQNAVEGQEQQQSNLIRLWRDVHKQAGQALKKFQSEMEERA
ncbi:hypothetical protein L1D52_09860 [Vibrio brasiliensis]|uniref:hypothetical protein n=1 Tax=Vibrio brasiliensis TaxID=170652 RepID=UPI001EFE0D68|nr:hypothetical protein [Vibrio brasiliensis]MCG9782660.1 hypothetical protein [Vibrio brasiliensis]